MVCRLVKQQDVRVRQALRYAIDMETICETLFQGSAVPANALAPDANLKGGDLTIRGGSESRIYTTGVRLDGQPINRAWIDWKELADGAEIDFSTAAKPSGKWGREVLPPSFE